MTGPWRTPQRSIALTDVMGLVLMSLLSLWPPRRGERHGGLAQLALLPGSDADTLRDPQQLAHRTAGSRSPPLV